MSLASRIFNKKQSIEKEIKDLYAKMVIGSPTAPTISLATTTPVVLTKASVGSVANSGTVSVDIAAAAANPTDTILADVTGTAAAIVITITPNDGTNNVTAASASIATTTPIVLTSVAAGAARNTETLTIQVLAAAANPTNTVLVDFTGTAAAIVCTVTPNDGTNNGATPVDLTTAELVELINTGAVVGKNITLTDGSGFRVLQTATGGDATALADAGEGDGAVGTFSGGTGPTAVNLTSAELAELLDSGSVVGKTVTVTDTGSLLANISAASGGAADVLADAGEGDGVNGTWSGGVDDLTDSSAIGIASVARNNVGDYSLVLEDRFFSMRNFKVMRILSSAADMTVQLHSESVSSSKEVRFLTLTGGVKTDPASGTVLLIKLELKNSSI